MTAGNEQLLNFSEMCSNQSLHSSSSSSSSSIPSLPHHGLLLYRCRRRDFATLGARKALFSPTRFRSACRSCEAPSASIMDRRVFFVSLKYNVVHGSNYTCQNYKEHHYILWFNTEFTASPVIFATDYFRFIRF